MKEKKELIRIVKNKEGEISLDLTGKKSGRGAYICKTKECFDKALKTKAFERAFSVQIDASVAENIKKEIADG